MTRLKKLKRLGDRVGVKTRIKVSSSFMEIGNEILDSGDVIGLTVRVVNWQPWYQVYLDYGTGSSSFYDGPDADEAFSTYVDLLLVFRGISAAESFSRNRGVYDKRVNDFVATYRKKSPDYYGRSVPAEPKFLGVYDL